MSRDTIEAKKCIIAKIQILRENNDCGWLTISIGLKICMVHYNSSHNVLLSNKLAFTINWK